MQLQSRQQDLHQNHCCNIDFEPNMHPLEAGFNHFELMENFKKNDERAEI